jgi:hypothetical protein
MFVLRLFFSKMVWKYSYNYITLHQTFNTVTEQKHQRTLLWNERETNIKVKRNYARNKSNH